MSDCLGKVWLVGAGPGDPGLLTRRGAECLASADVVIHDHLIGARVLDLAPPHALRIFAGKSRGRCPVPQDEINRLIVAEARAGRRVVRLKGGDPYVFGRGAEEAEYLSDQGIPFEVVPGVTAGVGATAYAGIPLTHRDEASAVAFVTGHNDPEGPDCRLDWSALARFPGTLVVYMGYRHHAAICRSLARHGLDLNTPAALVERGTTAAQRVVAATLGNLAERASTAGIAAPALLVVGCVVGRRDRLSWFEHLPLFGRRIVVTRPTGDSEVSARDLEALGAEVVLAPTVEILPLNDPTPLDKAIDGLTRFDWLVFTSANGVRHFVDRLPARGLDLRALGHMRLAAIGPATAAALEALRLRADLLPDSYRSEALAESLAARAGGKSILLARADRGRTVLIDELASVARVEQVAVYRNADAASLPEEAAQRLDEGSVDWVTVTSSAIGTRLHQLVSASACERIARGEIRLASISPVTSDTLRRLGWPVAAEAREYTWAGLVDAIVRAEASDACDAEPGCRGEATTG
jgi:uroporphyrinogen III methyltransferase/synthase